MSTVQSVDSFHLTAGRTLADKYKVVRKMGSGGEGEVFKVREIGTGVERAAKLFYPQRNIRNQALNFYARKLHRLRSCPLLIQYHTREVCTYKGQPIPFLISELVEGTLLSRYLRQLPGKRLPVFEGLHLIHALVQGIEHIHNLGDYHGDLHCENIIVNKRGLEFNIRIVDMYNWGKVTREHTRDDLVDIIRILYDILGGRPFYAKLPAPVKQIICGLKRSLIVKRFPSVNALRTALEQLEWN